MKPPWRMILFSKPCWSWCKNSKVFVRSFVLFYFNDFIRQISTDTKARYNPCFKCLALPIYLSSFIFIYILFNLVLKGAGLTTLEAEALYLSTEQIQPGRQQCKLSHTAPTNVPHLCPGGTTSRGEKRDWSPWLFQSLAFLLRLLACGSIPRSVRKCATFISRFHCIYSVSIDSTVISEIVTEPWLTE